MSVADMALLQALVVALLALILAPGYLFYFDITPKIVVLFAGTAMVAVAAALTGTRISAKSRSLHIFSALLLLNVLSLAVSSVLSALPDLSPFGANWRRFGSVVEAAVCLFAWLFAVTCAGRADRVRTILRAVAGAGALSALYGIAQYFGFDPFLDPATYHTGEGIGAIVRPPGTFGYASYFATWLLLVVFLSLALAEMEKSRFLVHCCRGTAVLAICAVLLSGTRAAVVGLAAGAVVWLMVRKAGLPRRALVLSGVALLAGVAFYFSPPGQLLRGRMHWFSEDPWGGARLLLWRDSFRMAAHRPLTGYGPETFMAEFPQFESLELAKAYPDFAHESPHNIFLDAAVAQGAPGPVLLAAICIAGLLAAVRLKQAGLAAGLAAAIVGQQFTAFTVPTATFFLLTVSLSIALGSQRAESKPLRMRTVSACILAVPLLYVAMRLATADRALALTQQALEQPQIYDAVSQYRRYDAARLPGDSADIWYARALLAAASQAQTLEERRVALKEAEAAATSATRTAEDPFNAWYNLAIFCGSQENGACLERSLREAILARPRWYKPHWTLSRVLSLTGRIEEAKREAALAVDLDGAKHPEVAQTLQAIRAQLAAVHSPNLQK